MRGCDDPLDFAMVKKFSSKSILRKLFSGLCSQYFGLAVLFCAALAIAFPQRFISWRGIKLATLVVPAIQLIMFGMGTTLSFADFQRVAKRPWAVAIGILLQFTVMPIVGFTLAKTFGLSGDLAAGFVLVGSVAGGTASNVIEFLAGADVALSVTMTCCSTLLSPLATPIAMKLLAGCFIEIDILKMMLEILKVVIFPVAAGALAHRIFLPQFTRHKAICDKILSVISMAGICFTILAITALGRDKLISAGLLIIIAAITHNILGYLGGYWITRLSSPITKLNEIEARTIAIEVGMQNSGLASALALGLFGSAITALPANIFSIWMNFSGSVLASIWRAKARPPAR